PPAGGARLAPDRERDRDGRRRDRGRRAVVPADRAPGARSRSRRLVIDTHAHLDATEAPPEELLARARAAGVTRVIAIGSGIESCRATLAIARREEGVFAALGIHPHQAASDEATRLD